LNILKLFLQFYFVKMRKWLTAFEFKHELCFETKKSPQIPNPDFHEKSRVSPPNIKIHVS